MGRVKLGAELTSEFPCDVASRESIRASILASKSGMEHAAGVCYVATGSNAGTAWPGSRFWSGTPTTGGQNLRSSTSTCAASRRHECQAPAEFASPDDPTPPGRQMDTRDPAEALPGRAAPCTERRSRRMPNNRAA